MGFDNPIEKELAEAIEQSSVHGDGEANMYQWSDYRDFPHENNEFRQNDVRQSFETFSGEFKLRLSQELDSMKSMVHNQIKRAVSNNYIRKSPLLVQCRLQEIGTLRQACPLIVRRIGKTHPG